jgi:hypothetical protein
MDNLFRQRTKRKLCRIGEVKNTEGIMEFYRYNITQINNTINPLSLYVLYLHKETDNGYWIKYDRHGIVTNLRHDCKWISKHSKKRFAYPTKEEAMYSFIRRQERRLDFINSDLSNVTSALKIAKKTYEETDYDTNG